MTQSAGGVTLKKTKIGPNAACPLLADVDGSGTALGAVLNTMQAEIDIMDAYFTADVTSGTNRAEVLFQPDASAAVVGVNRHHSFVIGDMSGNTAYGMGDPTKPTRGLVVGFGRTVIATSGFSGTDVALDVRMINKLGNDAAYNLQAAYFKVKNYSSAGVVGNMKGIHLEIVDDDTTTLSTALEIGADSSTVDEGIVLDNGTFTVGIDLTDSCTTGIDIGACTTAISLSGASTTAISFGASAGKIVDAAASISMYGGGTTGGALVLQGSSADAGQKITVTGASGTAITGLATITSVETTGDSLSVINNSQTSGSLIKASSTSAVIAAGYLLELDHTVTGDVFSVQTDSPFVSIAIDRNDNTTGTATENYDMVSFSRTNNNSAAGTMTLQGSVLKLDMVATDSGTMTNSVNVLEIVNTNTTVDTDGSSGISLTGIANVFAIPTLANTVNLFDFGAAAGCVVVGTGVGQDVVDHASGAVNADGHLTVDINGTPYYIPLFDTLET